MPYANGKVKAYQNQTKEFEFNPRAGTYSQMPLDYSGSMAPKKSARPKARPAAPMKSKRPKARPQK